MNQKIEQWDLILEAQADGTIPAMNVTSSYGIAWTRDHILTIAWDSTGFDDNNTRILLYTNNAGPIIYEYQLTDTIGQMSIRFSDYPTTINSRTILISREWSNKSGPRFKGKYIKIRVD